MVDLKIKGMISLKSIRIKFKKVIHSDSVDPSALFKNIIRELNKDGYTIVSQTQSRVEFNNNIWGPGSRAEVFRKVDGGAFDINTVKKSIVFSYYLSPVFEILAFCVVAFLGAIKDRNILFFDVIIVVLFFVRIASVKMAGDQLMDNIVNTELS